MQSIEVFNKLKQSFPNLKIPNRSELNAWLKESIPIIIKDWLVASQTLKSCGVVSSAFADISCANRISYSNDWFSWAFFQCCYN